MRRKALALFQDLLQLHHSAAAAGGQQGVGTRGEGGGGGGCARPWPCSWTCCSCTTRQRRRGGRKMRPRQKGGWGKNPRGWGNKWGRRKNDTATIYDAPSAYCCWPPHCCWGLLSPNPSRPPRLPLRRPAAGHLASASCCGRPRCDRDGTGGAAGSARGEGARPSGTQSGWGGSR